MIRRLLVVLVLPTVLMIAGGAAGGTALEALTEEGLRIPAAAPGGAALEALVVRPAGPGPYPLAIVTHGSPRDAGERLAMTPQGLLPQAREFARRGWAAAVVMRRGYGASEGEWAESHGGCERPDYRRAGERGAEDLRAAIGFMARQAYVDSRRVIAVGVSAGGFATVALTADPPPGLLAAVSFAGGRGSNAPDSVCGEDTLVEAFRHFGARSRTPMLWVYAENDHFFGPVLARRFAEAFAAGGGTLRFVKAPAFGEDGHTLFSARGIPLWTAIVDRFLAERRLVVRAEPIALPPPPDLPPPPGLSERGRAAFRDYLAAPPHKAFATSTDRVFAWRDSRRTVAEARQEALDACHRRAEGPCTVVAADDALVEPAPPAAAPPSRLCRPGARVEVRWEGVWYPARVKAAAQAGGRCPVHYDGYGTGEDEAVPADRMRARAAR